MDRPADPHRRRALATLLMGAAVAPLLTAARPGEADVATDPAKSRTYRLTPHIASYYELARY